LDLFSWDVRRGRVRLASRNSLKLENVGGFFIQLVSNLVDSGKFVSTANGGFSEKFANSLFDEVRTVTRHFVDLGREIVGNRNVDAHERRVAKPKETIKFSDRVPVQRPS